MLKAWIHFLLDYYNAYRSKKYYEICFQQYTGNSTNYINIASISFHLWVIYSFGTVIPFLYYGEFISRTLDMSQPGGCCRWFAQLVECENGPLMMVAEDKKDYGSFHDHLPTGHLLTLLSRRLYSPDSNFLSWGNPLSIALLHFRAASTLSFWLFDIRADVLFPQNLSMRLSG